MKKIILIGLGNPILGDDGAGWKVAEQAGARLERLGVPVEMECVSLGGLSLMERLEGYEHVILVDAIQSGECPDGCVRVFDLEDLADPTAGHSACAHDTSLLTALQAGRALGLRLPETITVVAIEATTVHEFSEQLSPAVAAAVRTAVGVVLDLVHSLENV